MIDLETYRFRIGYQNLKNIKYGVCRQNGDNIQLTAKKLQFKNSFLTRILLLRCIILFIVLHHFSRPDTEYSINYRRYATKTVKCKVIVGLRLVDMTSSKIVDHNFQARYIHGNIGKQKGIVNMHLNIRSLRFKVNEIKFLVKQHKPHIFGISETE